jgi:hypothetical protein
MKKFITSVLILPFLSVFGQFVPPPTEGTISAERYPMFIFDVPYGAPWTDFELKASRINFDGEDTEHPAFGVNYYYHSPGPNGLEIGEIPTVWYTATGGADPRKWNLLPNSPRTSIWESLADANSQVGSIIVVVTDTNLINSSDDSKLVWSMVWLDGTSREDDLAGRPIWRTVQPVRYLPEILNP